MSRSMKLAFAIVLLLPVGCASLNTSPPVESFVNNFVDEAIAPAIKEGISQGVRASSLQAGGQLLNPKYVVEFEGKWVVGIEGRATVGVEGLAGQVQATTVGDDETETSPHQQGVGDVE